MPDAADVVAVEVAPATTMRPSHRLPSSPTATIAMAGEVLGDGGHALDAEGIGVDDRDVGHGAGELGDRVGGGVGLHEELEVLCVVDEGDEGGPVLPGPVEHPDRDDLGHLGERCEVDVAEVLDLGAGGGHVAQYRRRAASALASPAVGFTGWAPGRWGTSRCSGVRTVVGHLERASRTVGTAAVTAIHGELSGARRLPTGRRAPDPRLATEQSSRHLQEVDARRVASSIVATGANGSTRHAHSTSLL